MKWLHISEQSEASGPAGYPQCINLPRRPEREAAALCADRVSEVEIQPALASVGNPTDNDALRQEITDLSRQVAALRDGKFQLHARFKERNPNQTERGPSSKESRPAFNSRRPGTDPPPVATSHPLLAGTITSSALGRKICTPPCFYRQQGN